MKLRLLFATLLASAPACFASPLRIALITDNNSNVFWRQVYTGAAKARDELKATGTPIDLTWDGPANDNDQVAQRKLLNAKIAAHVDGIVLSPTADVPEVFDAVTSATKAGIPTVVINAGLRAVGQISFVSTNNYKGGTLAARKMGALLKGRGKVVVFRWLSGNAASGGRENGFINVIKGQYPNIKIISEDIYANGNEADARKAAAEIVRRFASEADGIFAPTQITTETLVLALRDAGVPAGKVKVVGFDSSELLLKALSAGELGGIVIQDPVNMGYQGVMTLVRHLNHQEVDKEVDTGCTMVGAENLQDPAVREHLNPTLAAYP